MDRLVLPRQTYSTEFATFFSYSWFRRIDGRLVLLLRRTYSTKYADIFVLYEMRSKISDFIDFSILLTRQRINYSLIFLYFLLGLYKSLF